MADVNHTSQQSLAYELCLFTYIQLNQRLKGYRYRKGSSCFASAIDLMRKKIKKEMRSNKVSTYAPSATNSLELLDRYSHRCLMGGVSLLKNLDSERGANGGPAPSLDLALYSQRAMEIT